MIGGNLNGFGIVEVDRVSGKIVKEIVGIGGCFFKEIIFFEFICYV